MSRITEKNLQGVCDRINRIMGAPEKPYIGGEAQIGNHHISHAYGGVCLHRMANKSGGVTTPIVSGYVPKRELYDLMHSYIRGLDDGGKIK